MKIKRYATIVQSLDYFKICRTKLMVEFTYGTRILKIKLYQLIK